MGGKRREWRESLARRPAQATHDGTQLAQSAQKAAAIKEGESASDRATWILKAVAAGEIDEELLAIRH